jgi:hypothetical protein
MALKRFGFAGLLLTGLLQVGACGPPGPVYYSGEVQMDVESEPPALQVEAQPVVPYQGAVWQEGHWYWRGRWIWYPGRWAAPRQGWVWVPHHWVRAGYRWHYYPGHWRRW